MASKSIFNRNNRRKNKHDYHETHNEKLLSLKISKTLDINIDNIKDLLHEPSDLVTRKFTIRGTNYQAAIVYIDGMVDSRFVHNDILKSMLIEREQLPEEASKLFNVLREEIISATDMEIGHTLGDVSEAIMYGKTAFYLEGIDQVLLIDTASWESRAIDEPTTETVVRGPKEGFVE